MPAAKLTPPAPHEAQVLRADLVDRIARTAGSRLILVHAAAGFGKTTLMAQLRTRFQQEGIHTPWLTLDE